jgi:AraC-like DNA-binding protein
MAFVPPARHLVRARDLADARYSERLTVSDMARATGLSRAHFSREFRRAFGESPHAYLLTRRLERAAALLRNTDNSVAEICFSVVLESVGSFTSSFTRAYGRSPTAYRAACLKPRPGPELRRPRLRATEKQHVWRREGPGSRLASPPTCPPKPEGAR